MKKLIVLSLSFLAVTSAISARAHNDRHIECEFFAREGSWRFTAISNQNPPAPYSGLARIPNFFVNGELTDPSGRVIARAKLLAEPLPYRGKNSASKGAYAYTRIQADSKTSYDIGIYPQYSSYRLNEWFGASMDIEVSSFWANQVRQLTLPGQCRFHY